MKFEDVDIGDCFRSATGYLYIKTSEFGAKVLSRISLLPSGEYTYKANILEEDCYPDAKVTWVKGSDFQIEFAEWDD